MIERDSRSGKRYVGIYRAADGKYRSAGTDDSHERAYEVAEGEERHARGFLDETNPSYAAEYQRQWRYEQSAERASRGELTKAWHVAA